MKQLLMIFLIMSSGTTLIFSADSIPILVDKAHLRALAEIETGNDNSKRGRSGELSIYQILPAAWNEVAPDYNIYKCYKNNDVASAVAARILLQRMDRFKKATGRDARDEDIYVLWHRGVRGYSRQKYIFHRVAPIIRDRAIRYSNLALCYRSNN